MTSATVLCVDDEPVNLALLREILQDRYKLVFARNGADALLAAAKHRPSMLLLDVDMPGMDGFAVCRRLKRDPETAAVPVIFVTSLSEAVDEQAGFDAGAVDYITKPISPAIVRARVRTHLSLVQASALEESYHAAIHMLGEAGHYNDTDTGVHIWRMAEYAKRLARAAGWPGDRGRLLELAASMHDTGKIGIPDAILKKPGRLDNKEWAIMKTHSRIGYDILRMSKAPVFQLAAEIALYHHERWDGAGYPEGLAGSDIPESARIVAVSDVFDALTMKRPYKNAWPLDRALATLEETADTHLERRLVRLFLDVLPDMLAIKEHWETRSRPFEEIEGARNQGIPPQGL